VAPSGIPSTHATTYHGTRATVCVGAGRWRGKLGSLLRPGLPFLGKILRWSDGGTCWLVDIGFTRGGTELPGIGHVVKPQTRSPVTRMRSVASLGAESERVDIRRDVQHRTWVDVVVSRRLLEMWGAGRGQKGGALIPERETAPAG